MNRDERLQEWVDILSEDKMRDIIFQLVDRMIDTEELGFYEGSRGPYWDASGERLDGIEDEDNDD